MQKRIIIYIVLALIGVLGAYIYFGMFYAKNSSDAQIEQTSGEIDRHQEAVERLRNAGAMSEESRLELEARLQNATY